VLLSFLLFCSVRAAASIGQHRKEGFSTMISDRPARKHRSARKPLGIRDRVVTWLLDAGPLEDPSGKASSSLAKAVGYEGTSIAFAQLLSGMERAGLIRRNIRGKRTYRIELTDEGRSRARGDGPIQDPAGSHIPARGELRADAGVERLALDGPQPVRPIDQANQPSRIEPGEIDYEKLARQVLVELARQIAGHETGLPGHGSDLVAGRTWVDRRVVRLERKLAEVERELARTRAAREALEQENESLREQLEQTRKNLETVESRMVEPRRMAPRRIPPKRPDDLDASELALLQQMLHGQPSGKVAPTSHVG